MSSSLDNVLCDAIIAAFMSSAFFPRESSSMRRFACDKDSSMSRCSSWHVLSSRSLTAKRMFPSFCK
eukprot:11536279-Karenia_brevis.AAC.1